ncbi:MAG: hypothetical protein AAF449_13785 [Myxococcota bacterium]
MKILNSSNILIACMASALAFACGGEENEASSSRTQTITANSIASLPAGELLRIDLSDENLITIFDTVDGQIDYGRIEIICPNGRMMPMNEWMVEQANDLAVDFESADRLVISANPYQFGLDDEQVEELQVTRRYSSLLEEGSYYCCSDGLYVCEESRQ